MKLYALCDAASLQKKNSSLDDFVKLALKHEAEILQYRNKEGDAQTVKADLLHLRKIWPNYLIINDYIEYVPFCDGLHVGQEDLLRFAPTVEAAVAKVREEIGSDKVLGISTHNKEEILKANSLDLNYIGLGAFRPTSTKSVDNILGDTLDTLASLSKFPVGAIGGVQLSDTFQNITYLVIGSDLYEN